MNFSERLKELRLLKGISQATLAKDINTTDTSIQRYEYGQRTPPLDMLIALDDYFDVSIDYLVGRSDNPARL